MKTVTLELNRKLAASASLRVLRRLLIRFERFIPIRSARQVRPLYVETSLLSGALLPAPSGHHPTTPKPFVAGQSVEVKCRTGGSRPAPTVTWWKGNKQIAPHLSTTIVSEQRNSLIDR